MTKHKDKKPSHPHQIRMNHPSQSQTTSINSNPPYPPYGSQSSTWKGLGSAAALVAAAGLGLSYVWYNTSPKTEQKMVESPPPQINEIKCNIVNPQFPGTQYINTQPAAAPNKEKPHQPEKEKRMEQTQASITIPQDNHNKEQPQAFTSSSITNLQDNNNHTAEYDDRKYDDEPFDEILEEDNLSGSESESGSCNCSNNEEDENDDIKLP